MKILILEDEIYNFHLLRHMLEEIDPEYNVVGPITSIKYGIDYFHMHSDVDIIIADIQLNDGLSFDALKYAPQHVPVIFTTAYDQHALRAFEYNSLSYLLKPIDEDELRTAVKKAMRLIGKDGNTTDESSVSGSTACSIGETMRNVISSPTPYRQRFLVKTSQGERIVLTDSIRYIVSESKTTYIKLLDGGSYAIDLTLDMLSEQLDPHVFMRVNRKFIVPLASVCETRNLPNGRMQIILHGAPSPDIIISREKKQPVTKWVVGSF